MREPESCSGPEELIDGTEVIEADMEMPPRAVVREGGTFHSFRFRDFRLFWAGAFVSNTGSWMQNYALSIVVYGLRRSETDLGLVNFVSGLPVLILALFAGALADRVDKRRLVIAAQAIMLVQAAALGVLYLGGFLSSSHPARAVVLIGALGLLGGVVSALTFPAWQSMLPDLVPRDSLLNAIALNSAQFQSARLLGPLAASGLVIAGVTMGHVFLINAASFIFVIAALAAVRPRPAGSTGGYPDAKIETEGAWSRLTAGLRFARADGRTGTLIVSTAVMTIFGMPYMMLLPAIVDKSLGGGKLEVSYLMSANGLGAVVGALLVASLPKETRRTRLIPMTLTAFSLALIAFSLSRALWLSLVLSALAGTCILAVNSLVNTEVQRSSPHHLRGRVMALFVVSFMGLMPISSLVFGPIGEAMGPSNAVLGGAVVLLGWALYLLSRPKLFVSRSTALN